MSDAVLLTASIIRKAEAQDQEYALSDAKQPGLLLRVPPDLIELAIPERLAVFDRHKLRTSILPVN